VAIVANVVIPAHAGIQFSPLMDSRLKPAGMTVFIEKLHDSRHDALAFVFRRRVTWSIPPGC
jgi:hypothetical protein